MPVTVLESVRHDSMKLMDSLGFPLFPLKKGTKAPIKEGWQLSDPATNMQRVPLGHNYGVVLGPDDLVLDIDFRAPEILKEGRQPLVELLQNVGLEKFPKTLVVQTGGLHGGGYHMYFRKPRDIPTYSYMPEYGDAIQFKSEGGYMVGPGTIHPETGNAYILDPQGIPEIADLPPEILKHIMAKEKDTQTVADYIDEDSEININRYITYLKSVRPAIEFSGGDEWTWLVAAKGKDFMISEARTLELMAEHFNPRCEPPWNSNDLATKVRNAFAYSTYAAGVNAIETIFKDVELETEYRADASISWDQGGKGNLKNTAHNVFNFFRTPDFKSIADMPRDEAKQKYRYDLNPLYRSLAKDMFTHNIVKVDRMPWEHTDSNVGDVWSSDDAHQLRSFLRDKWMLETSPAIRAEGVESAALLTKTHPIIDYFNTLEWDGVERVPTLFSRYLGAEDNAYHRTIADCFLRGAVSRIFEPGNKFDYIPVLEGPQGVGKSKFCQALAMDWGADVFINPHDTQTIYAIQNYWIIEISEMEIFNRSNAPAIKAFVTRPADTIKKPYDKFSSTLPRKNVFIGTINPMGGYLTDVTGNRRFWPIACETFNEEAFHRDRDQIWAEALTKFKFNPDRPLFITDPNVERLARRVQRSREQLDPWVDAIHIWASETNLEIATFSDVCGKALGLHVSHQTGPRAIRVISCLNTLRLPVIPSSPKNRQMFDLKKYRESNYRKVFS